MAKILKYLKKYWYFAVLAPLFMVIEVGMDMMLTQYMQKIVDYGISTNNFDNIIKYGLIMIVILIFGIGGGILANVFTNLTSYKFGNDLRKSLFKKIMSLSTNQADDYKTGSLVTRVTNDITQIQMMISMCLRGLVRALSFFILGIVFTLSITKKFGMILLIILPIEILLLLLFMKLVFPVFKRIQAKLDRVNTVMHENVTGARVVKAFSKEEYEAKRFKKVNDDFTGENLYVGKIASFLMPALNIVVFGGQIVIYYIGGTAVIDGIQSITGPEILVGQITQAITYISMICMSIMMLGMMFTNIAKAYASSSRISEILDTELEIIDGTYDISNKQEKGTIRFENVSFKYQDASDFVLNNLSFEVKQGETLAVVGSTGCGKSTLVNLLVRFYDVNEGNIYVDGVNIKDYKKEDLRNIIGICLQKAELFAGTIKENISFGNISASDEEIIEAAKIAQAHDFISEKEEGYDEFVAEKGNSLSGGQKQRLSIARAILRKPEILILDDSTSALDLVTEANLYKALNSKMNYLTKIIVAQRIATAKNADRIMVLDNASIEAIGTHEELMQTSPVYKDIYLSQLKEEN